jgi:hypothetical protein
VSDLAAPRPAAARTPKCGVFRITAILDPISFDPHQTISPTTMTQLSFATVGLKVKAGRRCAGHLPGQRTWRVVDAAQ